VATSSTDSVSYGDLYQWGRGADGHQCRNSITTNNQSSVDQPGNGFFITVQVSPVLPESWRYPMNWNLWQGVNGVNNPCPLGYRLPTSIEFDSERLSWSSSSSIGAYSSPLKWSVAGSRYYVNGGVNSVGYGGYYWTSTTTGGIKAHSISINNTGLFTDEAAQGFSVRCIKN
jgi:uncharacterized protein (TIGR02145 family)